MVILFLQGLIIGFAIAVPVGPIALLCIQRSLHIGFKIGLMTGFGAALADGTYGLIASLGLTAFSNFLIVHKFWIRIIGGVFLLYLGIKLFTTCPTNNKPKDREKSVWHALATTYLLTLTNPATIFAFIAIFAGIGIDVAHTTVVHALVLVAGVICGSAVWWVLLSAGVAFVLHHRLSTLALQRINRFSGAVIFALGVFALAIPILRYLEKEALLLTI